MAHHTKIRSQATAVQADPPEGRKAVENKNWPTVLHIAKRRLRKSAIDLFAHRYLGLALSNLGRFSEAVAAYEHALKLYPKDPAVLIFFSNILCEAGNYTRAYKLCTLATEVAPSVPRSWITLLLPCYMLGLHQEAINAAEKARSLPVSKDEYLLLLNNLCVNLRDIGLLDEALAACKEAIELEPKWQVPYVNQMLFLQSKPDISALEIKQAADVYAEQFEAPVRSQWPTFADRDCSPHRVLRVAFLSPDFNQHSVMYFLEGVLAQLDRGQFCVIAIYLSRVEDSMTARVKRHCDEFHSLAGLGDKDLADRILGLSVDVLIDLAGHTAGSGLRAMIYKPAPVQVTWLGYPGTSGMKAIDWRITDGIADVEGAEVEYVEQLYKLPDIFLVYRPLSRFPLYRYQPKYQVRPTPALENGFITFGSCNNLSKLTDTVLRTWAKVLQAVTSSKLLIEGKGLDDSVAQTKFTERCVAQGIDPRCLILIPRDASQQYLTYHRIDIALDSFPLTGGTTSEDLLWMGVPLISMNGQGFRARMGVSLLQNLGHPEWIANTTDEYVSLAKTLASDVNSLNSIRLDQRNKMERSPVMDEEKFVRNFEIALRTMWHHWCAKQQFADRECEKNQALLDWSQHPRPPRSPQVTVAPSRHISLSEAHQRLQTLTETALHVAPREIVLGGRTEPASITHKAWLDVLDWCEYLLESIPNEPLALATLAEIEHAHGRTDFAATYLKYAQAALTREMG